MPVDDFYEWRKTATGKQPYAVALADHSLIALAGLGENWRSPADEWVRSFAIMGHTTALFGAPRHGVRQADSEFEDPPIRPLVYLR